MKKSNFINVGMFLYASSSIQKAKYSGMKVLSLYLVVN